MRISVAVPVRNETSSIRILLNELLAQTLQPAEIVLTDGGSSDDTPQIIEEFISSGAPVRLFREQQSMPGRSRNISAQHAQSDWIAFIDAGTKPGSDWLANLARRVTNDTSVEVVYGTYEPVVDSFFKECAAIAYVPAPF